MAQLILILSLCVWAAESRADLYYFTPQDAAKARERFGLVPLSFREGLTFDSDVPDDIQAQMRSDIQFISQIKGGAGSPLHQKIFGAVDGSVYLRFFESHIHTVGMDDCGNSNAVACVIPWAEPEKMWITSNYSHFGHPQIARLMVIFHESRHTEMSHRHWPHAMCPDPFLDLLGRDMKSIWTGAPLASEPACDQTPLGSYGSSAIMLKNIQKLCANCSDQVKRDAGLYAEDQLQRITDPEARRLIQEDFKTLETLDP